MSLERKLVVILDQIEFVDTGALSEGPGLSQAAGRDSNSLTTSQPGLSGCQHHLELNPRTLGYREKEIQRLR